MEEMLMMLPFWLRIMYGRNARVVRNVLFTFVSMTRSYSSSDTSPKSIWEETPALLTRTSGSPMRSMTSRSRSMTCCSEVRSAEKALAIPPPRVIS